MKVAILVEDYYQVLELWYPYYRLREAGFETVLVGPAKKEYRSKEGYPAQATIAVADAKPGDFAAVVVPGGYAPDILRRYPDVGAFVRQMHEQKKVVAAVCHAGWVLISAGIVKGKKITGFFSIKDDLINAGGLYEDKEVVVDGTLVTSRMPDDLPAFCREIVRLLQGGART